MWTYFCIGILIVLIAFFSRYVCKDKDKIFLILSGAVLVFFAGFRGDFCTDYSSYADFFRIINDKYSFKDIINGSFYNEKGFVFFNKIVGSFTTSETIFMLVMALLTVALFFLMFKKYSLIPWLTVLMFVGVGSYYDSFNITRQVLAAAIFFVSVKFLEEKKFVKYCIIVLLAAMIHRTALIMIPFYFLLTMKINKRIIIRYSVVMLVAVFGLPKFVEIAQRIFPVYDGYNSLLSGGGIFGMLAPLSILLFVLFLFYTNEVDQDIKYSPINQIALNATFIYIIFMALGLQIQIVGRMAYFFQPFSWILVANYIYGYKNKGYKQGILMMIVIALILYPVVIYSGTGYDPYYFSWSNR